MIYRQRLQASTTTSPLTASSAGRLASRRAAARLFLGCERGGNPRLGRQALPKEQAPCGSLPRPGITELERCYRPAARRSAAPFPAEKGPSMSAVPAPMVSPRGGASSDAEIIPWSPGGGTRTEGGRVTGVRLTGRTVAADRVIVAAGAGQCGSLCRRHPRSRHTTRPAALRSRWMSTRAGLSPILWDGGGVELRSRGMASLIAACSVSPGRNEVARACAGRSRPGSRTRQLFPPLGTRGVEKAEVGFRPFLAV